MPNYSLTIGRNLERRGDIGGRETSGPKVLLKVQHMYAAAEIPKLKPRQSNCEKIFTETR
jgi:hypothetical protein